MEEPVSTIRVGAVSYLNTIPLVWGMLHGPQRELVELSFSTPSRCADRLAGGNIAIGLVPAAEIARQGLEIVPELGISCFGAVRSILLFSRVPWREVKTLAVDLGSRTSVQLARIILQERYGSKPRIAAHPPVLNDMLSNSDAALIIGDPALRIQPEQVEFDWLDLGSEWLSLTGLPMVFAMWAGKPGIRVNSLARLTQGSYQFGRERLPDIVEQEYTRRGISKQLAGEYLSRYIRFQIGAKEQAGLQAFFELAGLARAGVTARA